MPNLYNSYDLNVDKAYIITVKGNENSEKYSQRCQESCQLAEMPCEVWDAFDGTQAGPIKVPDHSINSDFIKMLKITDHYLTRGEVACALSHISLWVKCVVDDKPLVVLEHDAVMVQKFPYHQAYNSIVYLGGCEQAEQGWHVGYVPPHASEGPNYHFICRAHAYSIDPAVAKNLLSHVLKFGIVAPLDIMMRTDIFNVCQLGLFAYDKNYDKSNDTTIKARPQEGRTTKRNDYLEY